MIAGAWTRDLRTGAVTRHEVLKPGVYGEPIARIDDSTPTVLSAPDSESDPFGRAKRICDAFLRDLGYRLVDVPGCEIETE